MRSLPQLFKLIRSTSGHGARSCARSVVSSVTLSARSIAGTNELQQQKHIPTWLSLVCSFEAAKTLRLLLLLLLLLGQGKGRRGQTDERAGGRSGVTEQSATSARPYKPEEAGGRLTDGGWLIDFLRVTTVYCKGCYRRLSSENNFRQSPITLLHIYSIART